MAYATKVLYEITNAYEEATRSPNSDEWTKATEEELRALEENNIWELVELPEDRAAIKGKWVFTTKLDSLGQVSQYKVRYVAKGCSRIPGIDFNETYSPTTRLSVIRTSLQVLYERECDYTR